MTEPEAERLAEWAELLDAELPDAVGDGDRHRGRSEDERGGEWAAGGSEAPTGGDPPR